MTTTRAGEGGEALRVRGLALNIGGRCLATDVEVTVRRGEIWCVIGANGVGKTMLLRTLARLRPLERGSVLLAGRALDAYTPVEAAHVRGFLPQTTHDAFRLSVIETVLQGRHPYLGRWEWASADDRRIADEALRKVAIDALATRDITTLSGGERQRVALAMLLAQDVPLLLLDEPVAHLDLHYQILVLAHLRSLATEHNKAIVLSIHDLNLARRFCTHAMLFAGGTRVEAGLIDQVMNAGSLSVAFGHAVKEVPVDDRVIFVAE